MINISKNDTRKYDTFCLENGIKVIICQDETSNISASSLNVNIGSSSDPDDIPGMAHFLEHMLFMGSKKFPDENYYNTFITDNGGSTNAFTTLHDTCFYYSIESGFFEDSLDIFSHFFIDSLLDTNSVEREMCAVDSEFWKSYSDDDVRLNSVIQKIMDPSYFGSRFTCGNLKTLKRNDIYDRLRKFYEDKYSSNLMTLAVIDKRPVEELKNIIQKYFSPIKNKNINPVHSDILPYTNSHGSFITASLNNVKHILKIFWQTPSTLDSLQIQQSNFFAHLIGHEGKNSLLSELKRRNLVTTLSAGEHESHINYSVFQITMNLTNRGNDNIREIFTILNIYLDMLNDKLFLNKSDNYIEQIYDEHKHIYAIKFDNKSKKKPESYVIELASNLCHIQTQHLLDCDYYHAPFSSLVIDKYRDYFDCLHSKKPIIVHIPSCQIAQNVDAWDTEEVYNVKYKIYNNFVLDNNIISNVSVNLPNPNIYIPDSTDVLNIDSFKKPKLLFSDSSSEFWLFIDSKFNIPKTYINYNIIMPDIMADSKLRLISNIYCSMLSEYLNEAVYDAELIDYNYSVVSSLHGMTLYVSGYSNKILGLWKTIVENFLTFPLESDLYNFVLEKQLIACSNYVNMDLTSQSKHHIYTIFDKYYISPQDKFDILSNINMEDLFKFRNYLLGDDSVSKYIGYVHGNICENDAINIKYIYDNITKRENINHDNEISIRDLFPSIFQDMLDHNDLNFSPFNKKNINVNNFVGVYYDFGVSKSKCILDNIYMTIFDTYISEYFFDSLRTKQQLGYGVLSQYSDTKFFKQTMNIFMFRVISPGKDTSYIKSKIKEFIDEIKNIVNDKDKFDKILYSYNVSLNEPFLTIYGEYRYFLENIEMYEDGSNLAKYEDYTKMINDKIVTFDGFIKFVEKYISSNNKNFTLIIE